MNASVIDRLTRLVFDSGPVLGVALLYGAVLLSAGVGIVGGWVLVKLLNAVGIDRLTPDGILLVFGSGMLIGSVLMVAGFWMSAKRLWMPEKRDEISYDMTDTWFAAAGILVLGLSFLFLLMGALHL